MILIDQLPLSQEQCHTKKQFNMRALTVWVSKQTFYIEPNYQKSLIPTVLKIDRKSNTGIQQINLKGFKPPQNFNPHFYSFLVGIISINHKKILLLVEEVELICTIKQRDILKITKPIMIFYDPKDKSTMSEEQAKLLINIVFIFEQGMYFSFSYNVTQPLNFFQSNRKASKFFNWASKFQKQLQPFNSNWSLPVIQGMVAKMEVFLHSHQLKIILISRRSCARGGPKQFNLGIDKQGHAANYVQTQLILLISDLLFSFVQIRGSIPLFWTENYSYGIVTKVEIRNSVLQNQNAFQKHIDMIKSLLGYENIIILNLLSQNSIETKLIQNYQYLVRKLADRKELFYAYFDLKGKCSAKDYSALDLFLSENFRIAIKGCSFTALQEQKTSKQQQKSHIRSNYYTLNKQTGVIRTNCMYCIDRTNIMQSKIALKKILEILQHLKINIKGISFQESQDETPFSKLYRNMWADNGDELSKQYTGTGSTQSYAIRKGKLSYMTSIDHGMTSIARVLRNLRHQDLDKNKTISFLLENNAIKAQQSGMLDKEVKYSQNEESEKKNLLI